jgi:hypothetical protein
MCRFTPTSSSGHSNVARTAEMIQAVFRRTTPKEELSRLGAPGAARVCEQQRRVVSGPRPAREAGVLDRLTEAQPKRGELGSVALVLVEVDVDQATQNSFAIVNLHVRCTVRRPR